MSEQRLAEPVGVIGLGIIGGVWAEHYQAAGILAGTWNRTPKAAPKFLDDPASVARASNVVHLVVADPPAVRGVLDRMLPELTERHLVIQSTTIDPASSAEFAALVRARGAAYVEVPFMGSRPAAEQRKIVFLLGGQGAQLDRAEAALAHLSELRFRVGTEWQASSLKLAYNLQVAVVMQGIAESLHASRKAEIPDETFFGILQKTALWSNFQGMKQGKLSNGEFDAQFSIKHMLKDVRLATALAGHGATPAALLLCEQLTRAAEEGLGDQDIAALIKAL
jgi:3-hydroxyisobutyrate dehydrogenase-like beta-hydroxyacid dehydrogenase